MRDSSILVSAIVSTYKGERFLRGCMDDLIGQTLFVSGQLEVLIVDSASPEKEAEIAGEFVGLYPEYIRYIRTTERQTLYGAWNTGIRLARGKYLTNANVDDRHEPRCLEIVAAALDEHPQAVLAYCDSHVNRSENASFADATIVDTLRWPAFSRQTLFEKCTIGPHPMWRADVHAKYGMFDETMRSAGDYEFWLRLAAGGETFIHVPQPLSMYLENPGSISLSNADLSWRESEEARDRHWREEWGVHPKFRAALPTFKRLAEKIPADARVALYGAGKHTQKYLPLFRKILNARDARLVAIFDDASTRTDMDGIPVFPLSRWSLEAITAVIPSSDQHEPALLQKLHGAMGPTVTIIPLYGKEIR